MHCTVSKLVAAQTHSFGTGVSSTPIAVCVKRELTFSGAIAANISEPKGPTILYWKVLTSTNKYQEGQYHLFFSRASLYLDYVHLSQNLHIQYVHLNQTCTHTMCKQELPLLEEKKWLQLVLPPAWQYAEDLSYRFWKAYKIENRTRNLMFVRYRRQQLLGKYSHYLFKVHIWGLLSVALSYLGKGFVCQKRNKCWGEGGV